jgi:hypothetical protein
VNVVGTQPVDDGAGYWHYLASDLSYPGLQASGGGDVGVIEGTSLGPFVPGAYDPNSRSVKLNVHDFYFFSSGTWAYVTAHEFGHAFGLDHAGTSDYLQSVMVAETTSSYEGLLPRPLDKCAAVNHWPVDINQ